MSQPEKKIIFASPVSDFFGGAERSMYELVLNSKRHGYTPIVIVPRNGEVSRKMKKDGIKIYTVNFDWWARGPKDFRLGFNKYRATNGEAVLKMVQIIQKEQPQLCVSYTAVFPWLAYASSITNTPHAWQICEMLDDENQWRLRLPIQETMEVVSSLSVKLFANSNITREHLQRFIPHHQNEIDVIYPYVNQSAVIKQSTREKIQLLGGNENILCLVGNIQPSKGQMDALKALYLLKKRSIQSKLILVGKEMDEKYSKQLRSFINTHHLNNDVIFTGFTTNPHVYTKAAIISLVSSPHEAFGRITIEALAIGTPVIGTDSDGTKEILQADGLYGLLYTPGNHQQLSEKIETLLTDKNLRAKLAKAGLEYAKKFTLDEVQKPFFDFLATIPNEINVSFSPLNDIIVAHEMRNNDISRQVHELERQNSILSDEISNIKNSKKYLFAEKVGKATHLLKNKD